MILLSEEIFVIFDFNLPGDFVIFEVQQAMLDTIWIVLMYVMIICYAYLFLHGWLLCLHSLLCISICLCLVIVSYVSIVSYICLHSEFW